MNCPDNIAVKLSGHRRDGGCGVNQTPGARTVEGSCHEYKRGWLHRYESGFHRNQRVVSLDCLRDRGRGSVAGLVPIPSTPSGVRDIAASGGGLYTYWRGGSLVSLQWITSEVEGVGTLSGFIGTEGLQESVGKAVSAGGFTSEAKGVVALVEKGIIRMRGGWRLAPTLSGNGLSVRVTCSAFTPTRIKCRFRRRDGGRRRLRRI